MTNPSDGTSAVPLSTAASAEPAPGRSSPLRLFLWIGLALSVVANVVVSSLDVDLFIGIGTSLVSGAFAVALAVNHLRGRRG